jgi:choline monooxygenase
MMGTNTLELPDGTAASPAQDRIGAGEALQSPVSPSVVDVANFADPEQLERELRLLFPKCWLPACPIADVAEPGDYTVWEQLDESVVIARTAEGELAAFYNVCQHRGAKLASGTGHCATGSFKCPWHGLSYDLRGVVDHIPLRESFAPEQVEGLRAPAVRVHEWAGFVWLALSDEAPSFDDYLGAAKSEVDSYDFSRLETGYFRSWKIGANWKMVVDAFNEFWHVPFAHKDSLHGGLLWRDAALRVMKPHTSSMLPIRGRYEQALERNDFRRGVVNHTSIFPGTVYNCLPNNMHVTTAWPVAPRESVLVAWGLNLRPEDGGDEKWTERTDGEWDHFCRVIDEDVAILTDLGRLSRSRGYTRNIYNSAEGRITTFHEAVAEMTGAAAPRLVD